MNWCLVLWSVGERGGSVYIRLEGYVDSSVWFGGLCL